jgi:hypothetical protein
MKLKFRQPFRKFSARQGYGGYGGYDSYDDSASAILGFTLLGILLGVASISFLFTPKLGIPYYGAGIYGTGANIYLLNGTYYSGTYGQSQSQNSNNYNYNRNYNNINNG